MLTGISSDNQLRQTLCSHTTQITVKLKTRLRQFQNRVIFKVPMLTVAYQVWEKNISITAQEQGQKHASYSQKLLAGSPFQIFLANISLIFFQKWGKRKTGSVCNWFPVESPLMFPERLYHLLTQSINIHFHRFSQ